jgi:phosphoglycerate dehydrogenase-like enzyme
MRVVFCGTGWFPIVEAIAVRLPPGIRIDVRDFERPLGAQLADAQVVLPSNGMLDASAIAAARQLLLIQQPAAGIDGIDLDAARARAIPVCNAPGANSASVAEAALLLILALARRLRASERSFEEARIGVPLGMELDEKTLGLVGLGRTGSRLARAAEGLGMRVLSVRSSSARADLHALLAASDVVSIHCPLTSATQGLFGAETIAHMKRGALLINCARGAILDRGAVEHALDTGQLGGLGLDTYWSEPWDPREPLFRRSEVVTLPHVAGSTDEAFARIADIVVDNIGRLARKEELLYRIA